MTGTTPWIRLRGRTGRLLLAAVVVLACARFAYTVTADTNRGDFFHTVPGPIVETMNRTLWERPEFEQPQYPKHAYTYGPTQYLTILPFLFAKSYDDLAAALLWLYIPLVGGAAILLWRMARVLAPAAGSRAALAVIVAATCLFFPILRAIVGREFETVCFALMAAAAYCVVTGRQNTAAGLVAYAAWFKLWPLAFAGHYLARRRYESIAVLSAVSVAVLLLADIVFGLEYFSTVFGFIHGISTTFFSGIATGPEFCADKNGLSLADGYCAVARQLPGFPPRFALIATLGAIGAVAARTFFALERGTLADEDRPWREFVEFSLFLTVLLTFMWTEYYYFAFLFIPIVGLGARYFTPASSVGTTHRALLVFAYCVLAEFVVPSSILTRLVGTDFWILYKGRGLYLAGELCLLGLLVSEYVRVGRTTTLRSVRPVLIPRIAAWRPSLVWVTMTLAGMAILTTRVWGRIVDTDAPLVSERANVTLKPPPGWQFVTTQVPVASPDGSSVAMIARTADDPPTLWIQSIEDGSAKSVPGTAGVEQLFWAPDGSAVAFFANGSLNIASLNRGTIQRLASAPNPHGGTWSKNGVLVFAPNANGPLVAVPLGGGDARTVTKLETHLSHRWPRFLDDGVHFVYVAMDRDDTEWTYVSSLAVDEKIHLGVPGATYAEGELVYRHGMELLGRPFNPKTLALGPESARLTESVLLHTEAKRPYTVSRGGDVSFWRNLKLTKVSRNGKLLAECDLEEVFRTPRLSPDRRHLAVSTDSAIHLLEPDTFRLIRVMSGGGPLSAPVWSPDGRNLAYTVDEGGADHVYVVTLDSGKYVRVHQSADLKLSPSAWTPDGRHLLIEAVDSRNGPAIYRAEARWDATLEPVLKGRAPRLSSDGRWLAFVASGASGDEDVFVASYPDVAQRWKVSTNGGEAPVWNGQELIYRERRKTIRGIPTMTSPGVLELASRETLFEGPYVPRYEVADGGHAFYVLTEADRPDRVRILLRKAPAARLASRAR